MSTSTALPHPHRSVPVAGPFGRELRAVSIGMVVLVGLIAFETLAVTTAMPTVADALDGMSLYALAFGAPLASGIVGMVVAGAWSDRHGPATALRVGVGLFVGGLLVAGLAPSMGILVAGRIAQGLGSGAVSVALYVAVAQVYPDAMRPRVFAAFAGAWVVPAVVGPSIAGAAVETVGWRWVFLAVPVVTVLAVGLVAPVLTSTGPGAATATPDGTVGRRVAWASVAAVGALGLHQGGDRGGVAGVVLLVAAVAAIGLAARRLLPPGTARFARGLPAVVGLRALAGAAFIAAEVYVPLVLAEVRGFSATAAGGVVTVGALSWYGGSWFQGRDRWLSPARRIRLGAAVMSIGVLGTATLAIGSVPVPVGVIAWAMVGLGIGLVYPTLSVRTLELSAPGEEGANSSALQLGDALGSTTVLALGSVLVTDLDSATNATPFLVCFAVPLALAVTAALVAHRSAG